jgi:FAD/FMN-containing dehydrogenase
MPQYVAKVSAALVIDNAEQLRELLVSVRSRGSSISRLDLRRLNQVIAHVPEDMTATVESGITLQTLQQELATHKQWLPIDPPRAEHATIGAILATNASGPRRCGYGTIREWLIGMRVMLANGAIVKTGGQVVKNVAGYDLAKLFIGSRGTLGIILEATFKLRPLPEREAFVQRSCATLSEAIGFIETILESPANPIVLDLHNVNTGPGKNSARFSVVLGFAGAQEDVAFELDQAAKRGAQEPGDLRHEAAFWAGPEPVHRRSVLSSRLGESLQELGGVPFVARAANGIIYCRGAHWQEPAPAQPGPLWKRVKEAFDPNHLFPDLDA